MGRRRVIPLNAKQFSVHLSEDDTALLENVRDKGSTTNAEVLRNALSVGLFMLAREMGLRE